MYTEQSAKREGIMKTPPSKQVDELHLQDCLTIWEHGQAILGSRLGVGQVWPCVLQERKKKINLLCKS